MTDATGAIDRNEQLLLGLGAFDNTALETIRQSPGLAVELMQDVNGQQTIVNVTMKALKAMPDYAENLRQVFRLNFITIISINPMIGAQWLGLVIHMIETNPAGVAELKSKWCIPGETIKYYGQIYLFENCPEEGSEELRRVMMATGLTIEDIEGYRQAEARKRRIGQHRKITQTAVSQTTAPTAEA